LRRASETGVANEMAEKERIPEPELDPDSSAGPSSAATRRSTKRTRATLRRAVEAVALADAGALSPDGTDAAAMATGIRASDETPTSEPDEAPTSKPDAPSPPEAELGPSIVTTPVAQPASTPTLRAQKRSRATARRTAAPTVAADAIAAPEAVMPRTRRDPILEAAMNLDNDQSMTVRMVALAARIGARLFADVDVQGLDHIPRRGPVILAVNHISNADPVVVGAWITDALKRRRIHWLGKRELFSWPVLGWIAARGGVHPVDRDSADVDAFRLATKILEAGYVLLVFPEGTRSPTGELQEAKDGAALLALRTGAQVVPIGVSNTDAVWRKGRALPLPFPRRRVTVRIGTPFRVQDAIPAETGRRQAKSLATTEIMGRIAALVDRRHRGVYAAAIRTEVAPEP